MLRELFISTPDLAVLARRLFDAGTRVVLPLDRADGTVAYGSIDAAHAAPIELPVLAARPVRSLRDHFLQRFDGEGAPRAVILGARPCDAAALPIVDRAMGRDRTSTPWFDHRRATIVVTTPCVMPGPSCFCELVGDGPAGTRGSDAQFVPTPAGYAVTLFVPRAEDLVLRHADLFRDACPVERAAADTVRRHATSHDRDAPPLDRGAVRRWIDEHPRDGMWDELHARCPACCECAGVCPTCFCEEEPGGTRVLVGLGEPRIESARFPHRVLHKFALYPERFDEVLCTGCGRCAEACPHGVNVPEIVRVIDRLARTERSST